VTGVDTNPDLRHARVYVSVLGSEEERQAALDGLTSARGFLQSQVGTELRMKRTPTLEFVHDPSIDHGMKMEQLISDVVPDDQPG
jgi:ribosome-binding factor A